MTKHTEIPADIREKAVAAHKRLISDLWRHPGDIIAEALMQERERCEARLAFADQQAVKVEALLEPHIKWTTTVRRGAPHPVTPDKTEGAE